MTQQADAQKAQAIRDNEQLNALFAAKDDQIAADRAAKAEAFFKQSVLETFVKNGGDATEFDTLWPSLRAEVVRAKTLSEAVTLPTYKDVAERELDRLYKR